MSKYRDCALFVDADGRYCCTRKVITITDTPYVITNANCGDVELIVFPTGDTDEAAVPSGIIVSEGVNIVSTPGKYLLPCDESLNGTDAPTDVTAQKALCCCEAPVNLDALMLEKLCAIAVNTGAPVDITSVVGKLCALLESEEGTAIEKLCQIAVNTDVDGAIVLKLCEILETLTEGDETAIKKLCAILELNEKWCAADAVFHTAALACLNTIKANTAAITGIETSLGQVGCIVDAEGAQTGSVLVCKVTDTTTTPPTDTIKVWAFMATGEVIENYAGPYEPCTNLSALLDCLQEIKDCPKPMVMQCLKKPIRCIGYDNGHTPGSSSNDGGLKPGFVNKAWAMTVKSWTVNGVEQAAGETFGPFGAGGAGWTEQLQAWADFFNSKLGDNPKCEAEFGFLPAPTWRYTKITCNDTTTQFGPLILERDSDGVCFTIWPILESYTEELAYRYHTVACDGVKTTVWCDVNGVEIAAPADADCYVDCATEVLPMVAVQTPDCTLPKVTKLCDVVGELEVEFYRIEYFCDGEKIVQDFDAVSYEEGNPEDYVVQGEVVNCITKEPIVEPKVLNDFAIPKAQTGALAGANYTAAFCWQAGRPNPFVPYQWVDNTDPANQVIVAEGATRAEFTAAVEALGYTVFDSGLNSYICPVPASYQGEQGSHFFTADGDTLSKPAATAIATIESAPAKVVADAVRCALAVIDCTPVYCPPIVVYDAVCNSVEQTVNGVVIPPFAPIIRQITTQTEADASGQCVAVGTGVSRYFNFLDPMQEFTDEVAFEGACDPQTTLCQERCDAKGRILKVVTITVAASGSAETVAFYDESGNLVQPALPLTVCDPDTQILCGCIRNADGSIALRNVREFNLVDSLGTSQVTHYLNGATITLGEGQYFDCDCNEKCPDTIAKAKYTYPTAGIPFPCTTSTINVDGEDVDLCGEGSTNTVIPNTGAICETGGIRSDFDGNRCYVDNTADPADYAAELLNFGSIGNKANNPLAAQATANFCMAVRGTFPSLDGTTAPTISLDATWHVGSGIALAAFDCDTGQDLDIVSGTISTYDMVGGPGCQVPSTRGPNDAWGASNNNLSQTTVFDTSGVADLGNVVFYSIVLNPGAGATQGDWLDGIAVQGLSPQGEGCDIQSVTDLVTALTALLPDCTVELVGENLCITCESTVLADFTCDETIVSPAVTDLSRDINPSMVALAPKSIAALAGDDSALTALLEEANELAAENLVNNTLTMNCLCNPVCPVELTAPLDKELNTLELAGNVVANYTAGQAIALYNANGEICGEATVAAGETPAVYSEPTEAKPEGFTTIQITECELQEGKTPAVIETAQPIAKPVKQAVKATVKQVSIREVKALAVKQVSVKEVVKKEAVAVEVRR